MRRFYHRTSLAVAAAILQDGFRDHVGTYMTDQEFRGVWLSDEPLDVNEGAIGDALLEIDLGLEDDAIDRYEWIEEGKGYREWLIPAALINANASIRLSEE